MAYLTLNAYDATLRIPEFRGLYQAGDGFSGDPRYAVDGKNVLTRDGFLRPIAKSVLLPPSLPHPIETLARLHRRYNTSAHDVLIAASGGQLYWILPTGTAWTLISLPDGWNGASYACDEWSYVAYEMNPEGSDAPVDVLLLSNAQDGMICVRGDNMTASVVSTPKKFGVITRYAERVWGGAITGDPDMLVYSAPFDPFDWSANVEMPEDGAGDVTQPSWDGDSFTALTPFGAQLLALKRTRVWRILGTDPGEYVFKEQYGGGTPYARTVAVNGASVLMLGDDGLMCYDGENVSAFDHGSAQKVFRRMNRSALHNAVACMYKDVYCLALPLDDSAVNNAVLMYDTVERTWLLRDDVSVESFEPTEDALYFTSAETPGRVWKWKTECAAAGDANPTRWVSPWFDFGYKNITKGSFVVYASVACEADVALTVGVQTEKRLKTKVVVFTPPAAAREPKPKRITFGGAGRRFRILLESATTVPWRLIGGLQVEMEIDKD